MQVITDQVSLNRTRLSAQNRRRLGASNGVARGRQAESPLEDSCRKERGSFRFLSSRAHTSRSE